MVKNPPAIQEPQETWARSLGWKCPLKKGITTYSSILAWRITAVPRVAKSQTRLKQLSMHTCIFDFLSDKRLKKTRLVLDIILRCVSGAPGFLLDVVDFDS